MLTFDAVHLHLVMVHLPIVVTPIALLLLAWGAFRQSRDLQSAALALFLLCAGGSFISKQSGERAEDLLEHRVDATFGSEALQHEHEEMAEKATVVSLLLGALSLWGILRSRPSSALLGSQLLLGVVATGMLAYTGYLGGQIRHSEVRGSTSSPTQADSPEWKREIEREDDDGK